MAKGKFFVFEGCDGSGKTTISKGVLWNLEEKGYPVVYTREPGGIKISEQIRKVILDPANTEMDVRTEALLYAASRRQHLIEKILPALEEGKIVICDRYVYSSLAYQGYARKIGIDEVMQINQFAIENALPDKTIYLDVRPQVGLERIKGREFLDRLDKEDLKFHQDVYEGYKMVLDRYKDNVQIFDGERDVETIINEITEYIEKQL